MNLAAIPDGRIVVARLADIYPDAEAALPLWQRRVLGLARMAFALQRDLAIEHDLAVLVAATFVSPIASA